MGNIPWWVYVIWGVVGISIGWWIGARKGYPVLGAVLGIFTVVGWLIMAMLPAKGEQPLPASTSIRHSDAQRPPDLPHERMPQHPPDVATIRDHDQG